MMADIHGSPGDPGLQMPAASAGPAPVPYAGPDLRPEPPVYGAPATGDAGGFTSQVMDGIAPGNAVQESAVAHDVNAGLLTSYDPGTISPVQVHGDADAGGRDEVAATVAAAVANAGNRRIELESDTYGQGSTIGDLMTFPPSPLDPGAGVGNTTPTGGFFDPPREYGGNEPAGGTQGAPGYQGEAV